MLCLNAYGTHCHSQTEYSESIEWMLCPEIVIFLNLCTSRLLSCNDPELEVFVHWPPKFNHLYVLSKGFAYVQLDNTILVLAFFYLRVKKRFSVLKYAFLIFTFLKYARMTSKLLN